MISYTYNSDGIRTSKTVNGVATTYLLDGTKIVAETKENNTIWYIYDENDTIIGFEYEGQTYYFEKSLQGDVLKIYDESGVVVSEYIYDAWGNIVAVHGDEDIAKVNPFRYRGYYQDNETGFYYLQSRYYDSEIGRFISADDREFLGMAGTVLSYNIYLYCENSPIIYKDSTGYAIETIFDAASVIWSLVDLVTKPSWTNLGYVIWDVVSIVVPCLPGSYVAKGGKIVIKVASKASDFSNGRKYVTGTYKNLRKVFKGVSKVEVHHLVEKRFSILFKGSTDNYLSIPLDK